MLPYSVGAVVECQTENKLKTLMDVRTILKHGGGVAKPTGFLFERKGLILLEQGKGVSVDGLMDHAIEAGATDVDEDEAERVVLQTEPTELSSVLEQLGKLVDVKIESSQLGTVPKESMLVKLDQQSKDEIDSLVDKLLDEPGVEEVHTNAVLDTK